MTFTMPAAIESEDAVVGALMIDHRALDTVAFLRPEDFSQTLHRRTLAAMVEMEEVGETPNFRAVANRLIAGGIKDADKHLGQLSKDNSQETPYLESHAKKVESMAARRRLIYQLGLAQEQAFRDNVPLEDIVEQVETALYEAAQRRTLRDFEPLHQVSERVREQTAQRRLAPDALIGIPTGFIDLDATLNGLHPAELAILAARPSFGKTALAANIALAASKAGHSVAVFSFEMGKMQMASRFIASDSRVEMEKLRKGHLSDDEWERVETAPERFRTTPIYLEDTYQQTILSVRQQARRLAIRKGLGLVIVDYMQLMEGPGQNRTEEVSKISRGLKLMAQELSVPVLALSQLSRACELRGGDHRPMLSDLRESGSIEQDADVVMFLYRAFAYDDSANPKEAEVIIAKHRNGPLATVKLYFDPAQTRFGNYIGAVA